MVKYLFLIFALAALPANAAPTAYKVDTAKSSLKFEAVQNGSPITGKFTDFSGVINFSKDDLANSNTKINIQMNSVTADYAEVPKTLKEKEWFDVSKFSTATFEAKGFKSLGSDKHPAYSAEGNLTIKGISVPVKLDFILPEVTPEKARAEGSAVLSRTKYNIGWAETSSVEDAVKVNFSITAVKQ